MAGSRVRGDAAKGQKVGPLGQVRRTRQAFAGGHIDREGVEAPAGEVGRDVKTSGLVVIAPEASARALHGELRGVADMHGACVAHVTQGGRRIVAAGQVDVSGGAAVGAEVRIDGVGPLDDPAGWGRHDQTREEAVDLPPASAAR